MARVRTSKKAKVGDLTAEEDPRAPLDGGRFLKAAQPVLKALSEDLLARARASRAVREALSARHAAERGARRTAEDFPGWERQFVDQVGAAWLLSCVFVRTLEDRGLLGHARIAGAGALDSQRLFFEMGPSLTERDYLLTIFRELTRLPAARELFDARHNPVWMLAPSAEGAKLLLGLFRGPSAEAPGFRFGQGDTRFLGDLYQDLNEDVQKRFALLQTPRFVESFILDRTLERAIGKFGLDETRVIDPTCGSGHFLLGAFERLYDHRLHREPGLGERVAAKKALDAVFGCDINPYAVAIAKFRLTLSFLEKGGFSKLAQAPELPLHVVVADSLLHKVGVGQTSFADQIGQSAAVWMGEQFALEDEDAAKALLSRRFAAVVGNPPYITVKDAALRDEYRKLYRACHREYSLAAPFAERFFELAKAGGFVGQITANSFMKREFGKKLIEEVLPQVNLDLVVNTSGAYIPGHGTPTVLLFGTKEEPLGTQLLAVLAKRGEPATPEEAENGLVWRSIEEHWDEVGFENDFISVAQVQRSTLNKHPWSLGGGGASELKELIESKSKSRLHQVADTIGFVCMTRADDVYLAPQHALRNAGIEESHTVTIVEGESVRDWMIQSSLSSVFPYNSQLAPVEPSESPAVHRFLWLHRTALWLRREPNGDHRELNRTWWEWSRFQRERYRAPMLITYAEVATHNHFVLDRGGKVFKQTAPIIKLPESATEDDHLALVAYLNSSTACFWMKQVCHFKTNHTEERPESGEPEMGYYAFSGTAISKLPLPPGHSSALLTRFGKEFEQLVSMRDACSPTNTAQRIWTSKEPVDAILHASERADQVALERMVALQEDLDWAVYGIMGLCSPEAARPLSLPNGLPIKRRLFLDRNLPYPLPPEAEAVWRARVADLENRSELGLLENPLNKRRWIGIGRGSFAHEAKSLRESCLEALWALMLTAVEDAFRADISITSPRAALKILQQDPRRAELLTWLSSDKPPLAALTERMATEAVPYLAPLRYTETGLEKRAAWERTWELQRDEDAGKKLDEEIPVPPKYGRDDYRESRYFNHRGKLDVPKERFITYPACESDEDKEPVYGWAGWNHLQQAQALAALYQKRKTEEAWPKDRITPLLAGLLEEIPWVKQWHNEPSDDFGGLRLGDYFDTFLDAQCRELGLTREELRAWRLEARPRRKDKPAARPKPPKPAEIFAVRPAIGDMHTEAQLVLSALVQVHEGRLVRKDAAMAFILLFKPAELSARSPRNKKTLAKAWLRYAADRTLPAGFFSSVEKQLLAAGMLRREVDPTSSELRLLATEQAPALDVLHVWYRSEAALALDVVAAMNAENATELGSMLAPEDRDAVLGRVA